MTKFTRMIAALLAIITGLPTLFTAVFQTVTKTGYDAKDSAAISSYFLPGDDAFDTASSGGTWSAGYAKSVLTPEDLTSGKYFMAGFMKFPAQEITGIKDDICVRAIVLDDGSGRGAAAFAFIDAIGVMNADIRDIRALLADITGAGRLISIDVGSTHAHSAPDTQGMWGRIPQSGRNSAYIASVVQKTADTIRQAYSSLTPGSLYYSQADHPEMFVDTRAPRSCDTNIHLLRFVPADTGKKEILAVNFGAHPVNLGYANTELSGDFPSYLDRHAAENGSELIYIQGAQGGGIGCDLTAADGIDESKTDYDKLMQYCDKMNAVIDGLRSSGEPVEPRLNVRHEQVEFTVDNFVFRLAERAKLCNVNAYISDGKVKLTSEIGYIEIGSDIKVLEFPGEALPELIFGGFYSASQAYNGTDYPYAPLKDCFSPTDSLMVFGLCNDALGYFVPDNDYCASNKDGHYEETVSTGSTSASTLSAAFEKLTSECGGKN